MTDVQRAYQLSASDFFLYVRRRSWFLLLFGFVGAVGLVAALGISSRATTVDDESTTTVDDESTQGTQMPSSKVAYVVEGFGTLRQVLSLVGVTEEASGRLFFPANSDVLDEFERRRDYYDARKAARSCEFQSLATSIEALCKRGSVSGSEIRSLLQESYDVLFEQRFGSIVALLARGRSDRNSEQATEVVGLLENPPPLSVRVLDVYSSPSTAQSSNSSIPSISFTFRNAVTLGVGGAFAGSALALLILFVFAVKSQVILSVETLRRCVPAVIPIFHLAADGPDLVGLEIRRLTDGEDVGGLAISTLGGVGQHNSLIEFSQICNAGGNVQIISGTVDQQVKTLIGMANRPVVIACGVGRTNAADLTRVIRAVELASKRVVGVVGISSI